MIEIWPNIRSDVTSQSVIQRLTNYWVGFNGETDYQRVNNEIVTSSWRAPHKAWWEDLLLWSGHAALLEQGPSYLSSSSNSTTPPWARPTKQATSQVGFGMRIFHNTVLNSYTCIHESKQVQKSSRSKRSLKAKDKHSLKAFFISIIILGHEYTGSASLVSL